MQETLLEDSMRPDHSSGALSRDRMWVKALAEDREGEEKGGTEKGEGR